MKGEKKNQPSRFGCKESQITVFFVFFWGGSVFQHNLQFSLIFICIGFVLFCPLFLHSQLSYWMIGLKFIVYRVNK